MMSLTSFCLTALLLGVSQCKARGDIFRNGKLSSGNSYRGNSYQHILVEEAHEDQKRSSWDNDRWYAPGRDSCFRLYKTRTRIERRYIRRVLRTNDRGGCEAECAVIRECLGFNYRYRTDGANQFKDNCELSVENARGAGSYAFYRDDDFDFYERIEDKHNIYCDNHDHWASGSHNHGTTWSGHDTGYYGGSYDGREECFRRAEPQRRPYDRAVRESFSTGDIHECMEKCHHNHHFGCLSFAYGYFLGSDRYEANCLLSDREYRDFYEGDLIRDQDFDFFERRIYDRECGFDGEIGSGRDTTATGTRCYRDRCRLDPIGQYWFCYIDDSGNSWDYCCAPEEYCSYSQDSQDPWCIVGHGQNKWRPCKMLDGRAYLHEGTSRMGNTSLSLLEEEEDEDINGTSSNTSLWNNSSIVLTDLPEL